MPVAKPKAPPPTSWSLQLGAAVGRATDFWTVGICPELDEHARMTDPEHGEFTHILRYQLPQRTIVDRVAARIDGLWQPSSGPIVGVGEPLGYLEIEPTGAREVSLRGVPGSFVTLWGPNSDHVFACGSEDPFVFYRRGGTWSSLPLPEGVEGLYDVRGRHENEVYFVGDRGLILLWDGRRFSRMQVPTTRYLRGIAQLDDTYFCVCGYQGTLLIGNRKGWRPVSTQVEANLLAIAGLEGKVWYGADDAVWSFDGKGAPAESLDVPAHWVSGLEDGLVISYAEEARLYHAGTLSDLDTRIEPR
jgi:hypothetical protein